jgi:hypothetical protein
MKNSWLSNEDLSNLNSLKKSDFNKTTFPENSPKCLLIKSDVNSFAAEKKRDKAVSHCKIKSNNFLFNYASKKMNDLISTRPDNLYVNDEPQVSSMKFENRENDKVINLGLSLDAFNMKNSVSFESKKKYLEFKPFNKKFKMKTFKSFIVPDPEKRDFYHENISFSRIKPKNKEKIKFHSSLVSRSYENFLKSDNGFIKKSQSSNLNVLRGISKKIDRSHTKKIKTTTSLLDVPSALKNRFCRDCKNQIFQKCRIVTRNQLNSDKILNKKLKIKVDMMSRSQKPKSNKSGQKLKKTKQIFKTRKFKNFQKTFDLMLKLLGDEPINFGDTQISEFEKKLVREFLFKKKVFKRFDLKDFNHLKLEKLRIKEKGKRTEEHLKFIFKKCINHIQKCFRTNLLLENKSLKSLLNNSNEFDYLFYSHYFGEIAEKINEPIEKFFHFRNWKNRTNENIPKSITKKYIKFLKMNSEFISKFENYLNDELINDITKSNVMKLTKLILEWELCIKKHGTEIGEQIILAEFKTKKMNLPWGVIEIKKAIKSTKDYIGF